MRCVHSRQIRQQNLIGKGLHAFLHISSRSFQKIDYLGKHCSRNRGHGVVDLAHLLLVRYKSRRRCPRISRNLQSILPTQPTILQFPVESGVDRCRRSAHLLQSLPLFTRNLILDNRTLENMKRDLTKFARKIPSHTMYYQIT